MMTGATAPVQVITMIVTCPQCNQEFYRDEHWKRVCLSCFKANKRKERQREEEYRAVEPVKEIEVIPPDVLRKLLYLCHPDKHNNSRVATTMFVWLSELKKNRNG